MFQKSIGFTKSISLQLVVFVVWNVHDVFALKLAMKYRFRMETITKEIFPKRTF